MSGRMFASRNEKGSSEEEITRISMSLPEDLLVSFDETSRKKGYFKRSEAIREALRNFILESKWTTDEDAILVGTISMVYDHAVRSLVDKLIDIQHDSAVAVKASLHLHLDEHNCMEIIAMEGKAKELKKVSETMISKKGVKNLKLTLLHALPA
ncbi:MAG: nickel-responsive transcriptional regulator NikR [Promethearchaeati archaeon SRVP18_Atabeyarchaeia-1]